MSDRETALLEENQALKERLQTTTRLSHRHQEEIFHLEGQINELAVVIEGKDRTIRTQQNRLNDLIKRIYGRKSEKLDPNQLVFDEMVLEVQKTRPVKEEPQIDPQVKEQIVREHIRRTHPGRRPLPEHLERVEHYLDIPEEDKYTKDGKERPLIGVDITEKLDYQPSSLIVNRYIRPKYGADDDIEGSGVKQHPPAEGPIDKCLAESGLLAHIINEKYEHHTPLYRQELKFERLGINISRKTMAGWMVKCAEVLKPLYERIHKEILAYDIVLNDDTPVNMLDPGMGKTKQTRLWCTVGGEDLKYTMYNFTLGRGREGPLEFFRGYQGNFMSDALASYEELFKTEDIRSLGCWAHTRRYFTKAQDTSPKAATKVLVMIAELYKIEKAVKKDKADVRLKVRTKKSRPQLAKILWWLRKNKRTHLPQSPMNQAIQYALNIRKRLTPYTKDARLPIDNNLAENDIRPIALGRNYAELSIMRSC